MKKSVDVMIANPAGNITIFVLGEFPRSQYQAVAAQLLAMGELEAEQVAFIKGPDAMEMCGLEFCGNASRSFALILAKEQNRKGSADITVNVSGCNEPLTVSVNTDTNYTKVKMPLPLSCTTLSGTRLPLIKDASMVDFGGIIHVILKDVSPDRENFDLVKDYIMEEFDPPAMGVMFYHTATDFTTPVVYVKDVDTTYFEGSCGSGSTAIAIACAESQRDGVYTYALSQPAGTIASTVEKSDGKLRAVYIEGPVSLSEIKTIEINL